MVAFSARGRRVLPAAEWLVPAAATLSRWLVVGSAASVARFLDRGWTAVSDGPILSDDFPDVMRLLRIE